MKKILSFLCCAALLLPTAYAAGPEVEAKAYLLMEKETGEILHAYNEHQALEPASVTKVMTILLIMEAIDAGALSYDDMITASTRASSRGGSQIWLKENERLSVRDMLKAICVVSANDCCVAMAEHLAGTEETFVERMNARAKELGMADTTFVNCTGLPAAGHATSAYDIALMSRELILRHPDIRQFTTIWMDTLRDGASGLTNTNRLIRFYEGATGLKTGSTSTAKFCLSATAERDGMELIAVVLGSPTGDIRFEAAKSLLNYGFSSYALVDVRPSGVLPPVAVTMGGRQSFQPVLGERGKLLLEKGKANSLETAIDLPEVLPAPIAQGQQVGTLTVTAGGETVAQVPVLAGESVARLTYGQILTACLQRAFLMV